VNGDSVLRDDLENLSRATRSVLWAVVALLIGLTVLVALAVALQVSDATGFGLWGAAAVTLFAVAVGALVFRRGRAVARRGGDGGAEAPGTSRPAEGRPGQPQSPPRARLTEIPPELLSEQQAGRGPLDASAEDAEASAARQTSSPSEAPPPSPSVAGPVATPHVVAGAGQGTRSDFYDALRGGDLVRARRVLDDLRSRGESPRWCDSAQRQLEDRR
jgi:hypothetical protein